MFPGVDAKMSEGIRQRADAKHPPYPIALALGASAYAARGGTGR
jgi:hypothetical protein